MSGISFRGFAAGSVGGVFGCCGEGSESGIWIVYTTRGYSAVYSKASNEERSGNLVPQASHVTK